VAGRDAASYGFSMALAWRIVRKSIQADAMACGKLLPQRDSNRKDCNMDGEIAAGFLGARTLGVGRAEGHAGSAKATWLLRSVKDVNLPDFRVENL
jgi:hypothetical protein